MWSGRLSRSGSWGSSRQARPGPSLTARRGKGRHGEAGWACRGPTARLGGVSARFGRQGQSRPGALGQVGQGSSRQARRGQVPLGRFRPVLVRLGSAGMVSTASSGEVVRGQAWQAGCGSVRSGKARVGQVRQARLVAVGQDVVSSGRQGGFRCARPDGVRLGMAGSAWHVVVLHVRARLGCARQAWWGEVCRGSVVRGSARLAGRDGRARCCSARPGRQGPSRSYVACSGPTRCGGAAHGMAGGVGKVKHGKARQAWHVAFGHHVVRLAKAGTVCRGWSWTARTGPAGGDRLGPVGVVRRGSVWFGRRGSGVAEVKV